MTDSIISTTVTSIPGFFSIAANDSIIVTKTGALVQPQGGYGMGGVVNVVFDIAGYVALGDFSLSSSGMVIIETGGVYYGTSLFVSLSFGGGSSFVNNGTFSARGDGVQALGGSLISNTGTLTARGTAVALNVNAGNFDQLTNDGIIQSVNHFGVEVRAGVASILNNGTINAVGDHSFGVSVGILATANTEVVNTGTIAGGFVGVQVLGGGAGDVFNLLNSGTITGYLGSFLGGDGAAHLTNHGTMNGDVSFGSGRDIYDGRGGTVTGSVSGSLGADTYYVSQADITLTETGTDRDTVNSTVSFRLGALFENLTLLDAADTNATGNDLANLLSGNSGDNRLTGLGNNDTLRGDAGDDRAFGNGGNDLIRGDDGDDALQGGIGNDSLQGDAGDDVLDGGAGIDLLTGSIGADRFVFSALGHTGATKVTADAITDFVQGDDLIILQAIDANRTNAAPNDSFAFVAGGFTSVAGQVTAVQNGGFTYVLLDVDGNATSDAMIRLNGQFTLTAADFIL